MSNMDVLNAVSEHTTLMRDALWLRQIRYNEKTYGFDFTLHRFRRAGEGSPGIVVAAGAAFEQFGFLPQLQKVFRNPMRKHTKIIACDGALPVLARNNLTPDFVVSVDAHPVVANFYRRSRNILKNVAVLLLDTVHRDVVNECKEAGAKVYWFQPFWDREHSKFFTLNLPSFNSGGNVGTTAFLILSGYMQCSPVGLLGLEFSWSDETPLYTESFYNEIMKVVDGITPRHAKHFRRIHNDRDGKVYMADPTYKFYLERFRELWRLLPKESKKHIFNLTKEGILSAPGLEYMSVEGFLDLAEHTPTS